MRSHKTRLLTSISILALAAAGPNAVLAADLGPPPAIADQVTTPVVADSWSLWVEGGWSRLGGDPGVAGLDDPPFDVDPERWGWEAAGGFDYRFAASPWIWSAQFRYGKNDSNSATNDPVAIFLGSVTPPVDIEGSNSARRDEHHWEADFMVGRDLGLGLGQQVVKFGVRVAEIRGKTKGSAEWKDVPVFPTIDCATAPSYCGSEVRDYQQKNRFRGVGPRVELDGNVPLGGAWSLDYMGGVAALYGRRKVNQSVAISNPTVPTFTGPAVLLSGGPVDANSSSHDWVFNLDAMAGISYAFGENTKVTFSYRFDGYWDVLRGFDSNGNPANLDRTYQGPMLRVVMRN